MKIDKNIPIPTSHHSNSKYAHLIHEMEVGDSIKVESISARASVYQTMTRQGFKPISRKFIDENHITYRIWRTK